MQNPEFNDGLYVAVSNDGQINGQEMLKEYTSEQICPVMCFEEGGEKIAPVFSSPRVALDFAKRNTPRSYKIGIMETSPADRQKLVDAGYVIKELSWPNKRNCHVHVMFLEREVETHNMGSLKDPRFFSVEA